MHQQAASPLRLRLFTDSRASEVTNGPSENVLITQGHQIAIKNRRARTLRTARPSRPIVKHGILLAFVLTLLAFLVGTTPSNGQETLPPSAGSNNAGPPNTLSVTKATTCTEKNGNPCPEWVHKLIGQYPPSPESEIQTEQDPSSVHFWTYRGWQDPPLRTNKQVFHSKVFLAAHIGGAIAMIVACRTNKSGGKLWSRGARCRCDVRNGLPSVSLCRRPECQSQPRSTR